MPMRTTISISLVILGTILFGLMRPTHVLAVSPEAGTAASMSIETLTPKQDMRIEKLRTYLAAKNSPLTDYAGFFISESDRLQLDWRLVVAIAGVESTFGRAIPQNSYNGWGWGIFTGQSDGIHFASWADGITKVSEGLRYRYINHGAESLDKIGQIYAASPAWTAHVQYFIHDIDSWTIPTSKEVAFSKLTL